MGISARNTNPRSLIRIFHLNQSIIVYPCHLRLPLFVFSFFPSLPSPFLASAFLSLCLLPSSSLYFLSVSLSFCFSFLLRPQLPFLSLSCLPCLPSSFFTPYINIIKTHLTLESPLWTCPKPHTQLTKHFICRGTS